MLRPRSVSQLRSIIRHVPRRPVRRARPCTSARAPPALAAPTGPCLRCPSAPKHRGQEMSDLTVEHRETDMNGSRKAEGADVIN